MVTKVVYKDKVKLSGEQDTTITAKVDRLFELTKQLNAVEALAKELKKLKEELVEYTDSKSTATEGLELKGTGCLVFISARAKKREINDVKKVYELLGSKAFFEIATVTLGDVDKYISENEQKEFVTESLTGARKVAVKAV